MGWGDAFQAAYDAATDAAKSAADTALSSARDAAAAVGRVAQAAADKAVAAARGVGNVVDFAARAAAETAGTAARQVARAGSAITDPFRQASKVMAPLAAPRAVQPCEDCWDAKKERLEKRNQVIAAGRASADPAKVAAAGRLAQNNDGVELARLSANAYAQYPTATEGEYKYPDPLQRGAAAAPSGWTVLSGPELEAKNISTDALVRARAVVYQTPADWPGGQKTVLAFRGTDPADVEDLMVDHDQAMSLPTAQYTSAMKAGREVAKGLGNDVLVTGHSLGGGKAQAAGAVAGLDGTMFNSAGLSPDTVDGMMPSDTQFQQYRSSGDPLTGVQNSPMIQTAVAALAGALAMPLGAMAKGGNALSSALGGPTLSPQAADYADKAMKAFPRGVSNLFKDGNVIPPAVGPVHVVNSLADSGSPTAATDLLGQHSMAGVINGIEQQKDADVATIAG